MRSVLILLFLICGEACWASQEECLQKLTANHTRDSAVYRFNISDNDLPDFGRDYLGQATFIIKSLLFKEGCSAKDVNFGEGPGGRAHSACTEIVGESSTSRVCYRESNLGYFTLSYDALDFALITFARWD